MSEANPNSRGWRRGLMFIDYEYVALAYYKDGWLYVGFTLGHLSDQDPMNVFGVSSVCECSEAAAKTFFDGLEIYRSNR